MSFKKMRVQYAREMIVAEAAAKRAWQDEKRAQALSFIPEAKSEFFLPQEAGLSASLCRSA